MKTIMSSTKEFIGGKFPKPVKAALKERANAAGLTMQEYVERIFVGHLDQDGDEMISRDEFRKLLQEELAVMMPAQEAVPDTILEEDFPEGEPDDPEEDLNDFEREPLIPGTLPTYLSIADLGGLEAILSEELSAELNSAILRAWEEVRKKADHFQIIAFLEALADELQERLVHYQILQ